MLRVNVAFNKEFNGIELQFTEKPSADVLDQVKKHGFRWHPGKKFWFAKNTTARAEFVQKLSKSKEEIAKPKSVFDFAQKVRAPATESLPNTFAAHYDRIGDAVVLKDGAASLGTYMEAFCEKENLYFRRTYGGDSMTIYDLSNAQKVGKTCNCWTIYGAWNDSISLFSRLSKAGIETIAQLSAACQSSDKLDGISINQRACKGLDVFSPFVEVKPLDKLPEKWTKRHFTQALMSGQLFRGEVSYHYTDDYAMDAANNFGTGRGFHMADFAKREVGDWGSCTTCYGDTEPDKNGSYKVHYSEHSNSSKTLWFDLNCDIAEGKRRAQQREQARQSYNAMMKDSCISVDPSVISPLKIYNVEYLDMDQNTGVYGTTQEVLQGDCLRDRLDPACPLMEVLSVQELEIQPDLLYSVSNFHNRLSNTDLKDDRIIPVGNWEHVVTGKALLELTAEGRYFPDIHIARGEVGPTYETAIDNLEKLANGTRRYMMGGDKTDYHAVIRQLQEEYSRAGGIISNGNTQEELGPRRFQDILEDIRRRSGETKNIGQQDHVLATDFTRN